MGPRFKVSSEIPEKRGMYLAIPGLVGQRVIHYTTVGQRNRDIAVPDIIICLIFRVLSQIIPYNELSDPSRIN